MRFFITDDCNLAWDEKQDFFLYGGIVVPENQLRRLAEGMIAVKQDFGIPKERPLKWTNNKWKGTAPLDEKIFAAAKGSVLDLVAASTAQIIVVSSPQMFFHEIKDFEEGKAKMAIEPETYKRTQVYALNDALHKFNMHLTEEDELGIVLSDSFADSIAVHMDEHCFNIFPHGVRGALPQIVHPVIQLDNERSHLHQINDVVVGSIHYSLREMTENFLPQIKGNFWRSPGGGDSTIMGRGFTVFPEMPKYPHVVAKKSNLQGKFLRLIGSI